MNVDELIAQYVQYYVSLCQLAAQHDEMEHLNKLTAHRVFYHIQELRSTRIPRHLGQFIRKPPISNIG